MANLIVPYSRRHDAEIDRKRFPCAAWRQKEPQTLFLVRHDAKKSPQALFLGCQSIKYALYQVRKVKIVQTLRRPLTFLA